MFGFRSLAGSVIVAMNVVVSLLSPCGASAQSCPATISSVMLDSLNESRLGKMVPDGDFLYGADSYGLGVWDWSDRSNPELIGHWSAPEAGRSVTLARDHVAVLADGSSGMMFIDFSTPSDPHQLCVYDTPGIASGVTSIGGHYVLLADSWNGLLIFDINDLDAPVLTGAYTIGDDEEGSFTDVIVSGDVACVLSNDIDYSVLLIDISDINHPSLLGSYHISATVRHFAVSGDLLFIALSDPNELRIVDISSPATPTLLSVYDTLEYAWGISVSGDTAFLSCTVDVDEALEPKLQLLDIENPASPLLISSLPVTATGKVMVDGESAVVSSASRFEISDVADENNPGVTSLWEADGEIRGIAIEENVPGVAYVADEPAGLLVMDISDPSNPSVFSQYLTPDKAVDVDVNKDTLCVVDRISGLLVFDVTDPLHPDFKGTYEPGPGGWTKVTVSGSIAYLYGSIFGVLVIDVSDLSNPTLLSDMYDHAADDLAVSGTTLYLGEGNDGLTIIDLSDPTNPVQVGNFSVTHDDADCIAVSGNTAYILSVWDGLMAVDVSDPATPVLLGSTMDVRYGNQIGWVENDRVWIMNNSNGIKIFDVSDPSNMSEIGEYGIRGSKGRLAVATSSTVFVADEDFFYSVSTGCAPPEADFYWDVRGLNVEFRDRSLYGPIVWGWDFGDGTEFVGFNPSHTFSAPGYYTVSLTIEAPNGGDEVSHMIFVGASVFSDGFESGDMKAWSMATH